MSSKGSNITFFAAVTLAVVAIGGLAVVYIGKAGKESKKIDDGNKGNTNSSSSGGGTSSSSSSSSAKGISSASTANTKAVNSNEVIIEDASDDDSDEDDDDDDDDDDDENSEEKQKDLEMKALQEEYERTINLAAKLLKGNSLQRASEKYTEAIQLASKIPSQGKDLITLYNNRSATYEKSGDFKQSLSDIAVVLTMDTLHLKGRTRRARVLEAQGKLKEALDEYTLTMFIERDLMGQMPSNAEKIDLLAKKVAAVDAEPKIKVMRNSPGRPLPSKGYCKNFLETFPSTHKWSAKFKGKQSIESSDATDATDANDTNEVLLQKAISDLVNSNYSSAFEDIEKLRVIVAGAEGEGNNKEEFLSTIFELSGTEKYLKCNLEGAINDLKQAVQLNVHNHDAHLKLASIYLELGELSNAGKCYEEIINNIEIAESQTKGIDLAWVLIHRSSLWVTRNDEGTYDSNAIEKAIKDVDKSLELLEPFVDEFPEAKAGKLISLLKSVHLLNHTKAVIGLQMSEDDVSRNERSITEAKRMCPDHESVRILESDTKASTGAFDEALAIVDALIKDSDPSDSIPTVIKGNILTQKAIFALQNNPHSQSVVDDSRQIFKDVEALYEQAVKIEPNGLEALIQHAHMMNMIGQNDAGEKLIHQAIPHARTRDELIELCQLLALTTAQIYAGSVIKPQIELMMSRNR